MTYSGWANYETWVTALHIDNDEGYHYAVKALALANRDRYELSQRISDFVDDLLPGGEWSEAPELAGLADDLLTSARQEIDYREIATAWLDSTRTEYNDNAEPEDREETS